MQQNRFSEALVVGKGLLSNIIKNAMYAIAQGELAISTDQDKMFIGDANYRFKNILYFIIPQVVCSSGEVIVSGGEIVWN